MHQWASLQKLIHTWEEQEVKDSFLYETFDYKPDEWDNVPPVIPRFQFYLQNCLRKTVEFTKEVRERQTTEGLKNEMYENFASHKADLDEERSQRVSDVTAATTRKDELQRQVDVLDKYNIDKTATEYQKGQ